VVRLSEVSPEGVSSLVATGVLNLTHRRSDTDPEPMPPDRPEEVRIPLRTTGYRFGAGNQIRLTVMSGYWPVLWPSPLPGRLMVFRSWLAPSRLVLPVLPSSSTTLPVPPFRIDPVVMRQVGTCEDDAPEWRIEEDVTRGTLAVTISEGGTSTQEDGSRLHCSERLVLTASDADPAHARLESDVVYRWSGFGAEADIRARGTIASDDEAFDVRVALDVALDGKPFFAREWQERIPRNLV
jgi:hypothetical protein